VRRGGASLVFRRPFTIYFPVIDAAQHAGEAWFPLTASPVVRTREIA
jgi:hypothetical protein